MRSILTVAVLLLLHLGPAWGMEHYTTSYGEFRPGQYVHSFGNNVNIRQQPDSQSPVMDRLKISAPVKIISRSDKQFTLNGYRDYWYLVEYDCSCGNKRDQGYVWGGLLSKSFLILEQADGYPSMSLLFGIVGQVSNRNIFEARYVEYNQQKFSLKFEGLDIPEGPDFSYSLWADAYRPGILARGVEVFTLHFAYEADEYPQGDILLLRTDKGLVWGLQALHAFSEVGRVTFRYIWPADSGGKKNHIIVESTSKDYESGQETVEKVSYRWDGQKLLPAE